MNGSLRCRHNRALDGRRLLWVVFNSQLPAPNYQPLPTPTPKLGSELGIGIWEWLGVGSWELGIESQPSLNSERCDRIDTRRAAGWHIRRQQRGTDDDRAGCGERRSVTRLD